MERGCQQTAFETARTNIEFVQKVNAALSQFEVFHLNLRTPEAATEQRSEKSRSAGFSSVLKKDGYDVYIVRRGSATKAVGEFFSERI